MCTEMKWIDWNYLRSFPSPLKEVCDVVYERCKEMGVSHLMNLACNWKVNVVAQFYATLVVDEKRNVMHFHLVAKDSL
jgi:hypothetical protein